MDFKRKKISKALSLLSSHDISRFRLYLSSPFFVKSDAQPVFILLFDRLCEHVHDKASKDLDLPTLYKELYPQDRFVQGKIEKLITKLTSYLLQYLGVEEALKTNGIDLETLKALRLRGVADLWSSHYRSVEKTLEQQKNKSLNDGLESFRLDLEKFRLQNKDPLKKDRQNYAFILNALDNLYRTYGLEIGIQVLAYNKFIFPIELEERFKALKMILLKNTSRPDSSGEVINVEVFRLLSESKSASREKIEEFLALIESHKKDIPASTYTSNRSIARNLAIHLYNTGDRSMEAFIFNMYKEDADTNSVFHNNKISAATVNNITTFALRQRAFDWLETFLDKVENIILEKYIESFTLSLNRAKILFYRGRYEEVLGTLEFDVQDVFLKINSRLLELMTHFELRSDQLNYKIEAFKIFIYRLPESKASANFIAGNNNFIDILKSICHPKTAYDASRIQKIKAKILHTDLLAEKDWLLEKMQALDVALKR